MYARTWYAVVRMVCSPCDDGLMHPDQAYVPLPPGEEEWAQTYRDCGYDWCRPCREWHRPPECWITPDGVPAYDVMLGECCEAGRQAWPDGCPWHGALS